jgi:hypothetical protein
MKKARGLSLAELLIASALVAGIALSMSFVMAKNTLLRTKLSSERQIQMETLHAIVNLRQRIQLAPYLLDTTHTQGLFFDYADPDGQVRNSHFLRISNSGGVNVLSESSNYGSAYGSPYPYSDSNKYRITAGEFYPCRSSQRCIRPLDTTGDGHWVLGADTTPSLASGFSGSAFSGARQANKVLISGLTLQMNNGEATLTLPNIYMALPQSRPEDTSNGLVMTTLSTLNTAAGSNFEVRNVAFDSLRRRMFVVGSHTTGTNFIYPCSRDGVLAGAPINTGLSGGSSFQGAVLEDNGRTLLLLDSAAGRVYRVNTHNGTVHTELNISSFVTNAASVAFDPSTSNDYYIIGADVANPGTRRIFQRNKITGAAVTSWEVPAGLTNPAGMVIEPLSGDFYVVNNVVSGTGSSRTITLYRITRANPTNTDTFTLNIAGYGSTATNATSNFFGLSYDRRDRRLILSDLVSDLIVVYWPARTITPVE